MSLFQNSEKDKLIFYLSFMVFNHLKQLPDQRHSSMFGFSGSSGYTENDESGFPIPCADRIAITIGSDHTVYPIDYQMEHKMSIHLI